MAKKAPKKAKKPAKKAKKATKKAVKKATKKAPKKAPKKAKKPAKKAKKATKKPAKKTVKKAPKRAPPGRKIALAVAPKRLAYVYRRLREGVSLWQERLHVEGWDSTARTHANSNNTIDAQIDFYFNKPPREETVAALAFDCQKASKIPIMNAKLDKDLYMSAGFLGTHKASGRALYGKGAGEADTVQSYPMRYGYGNTTFLTMRTQLIAMVSDMKVERFFVRLAWSPGYVPDRKKRTTTRKVAKASKPIKRKAKSVSGKPGRKGSGTKPRGSR